MKTLKVLIGVVALSVIGFFIYWFENKTVVQNEHVNQNPETATLPETKTNAPTQNTSTKYKDGEYKIIGEYTAPSGLEKVSITFNILGDKINSLTVESLGIHATSKKFQGKFIDGIQSVAVGQNLEDFKVDVVSGASLTSGAFNKALAQVRQQAALQ
jgi:uncharacterized protein with FMN-binding domain